MADIVQTAVRAGYFRMLVRAVQTTGLGEMLSGPGPFTVFAPNDVAFAKLLVGTIEGLLKDTPRLKDVLTYHIVAGKHMAADIARQSSLRTLQGHTLTVETTGGIKVGGVAVVQPDIQADNGVIHVINSVMIPK